MLDKILFKLTGGLPCRLIPRAPGRPYLERYYVGELLGATFYVHRFVSSDEEPHLHNHPWRWSRSAVLSGSYVEEVATDICPAAGSSGCVTETRKVRWWNRVDGNRFHRITQAEPGTWTLFFHGPRQRVKVGQCSKIKGWGFLERDGSTTVFRPFPVGGCEWWYEAPKGKNSKREPVR